MNVDTLRGTFEVATRIPVACDPGFPSSQCLPSGSPKREAGQAGGNLS